MTVANDPISVIVHPVSGECECNGLTKREYFAAMETPDMEGYAISVVELLMGKQMPVFSEEPLAQIKYWAEFKAMLKCIAADALIEALNK